MKPEIHFDNAGEAFDGEMIVLLKGEDGVCAKQYSRTVTIPSGRQILSPEPEKMAAPALWDIDHPYLYTVEMRLIKDGVEMDEVESVSYTHLDVYKRQVKDSGWLLSWTINRQPQFRSQPKDQCLVGVYGLFSDKPGDYVKKPMRECTGKEICICLLYTSEK